MILESLALLFSHPIHKEAELEVDQVDCNDHFYCNGKCCYSCEKADKQPDSPKEFSGNSKYSECERDAEIVLKMLQGGVQALTPEPAEGLLGAVRKQHYSESKAQKECRKIMFGSEQSHVRCL